jgi:hypothetical protein
VSLMTDSDPDTSQTAALPALPALPCPALPPACLPACLYLPGREGGLKMQFAIVSTIPRSWWVAAGLGWVLR